MEKKFSRIIAAEPDLKLRTTAELEGKSFYEIQQMLAAIYISAQVPIPSQMKTTVARNYYRMNEGDDSEKTADKFADIEKLANLF